MNTKYSHLTLIEREEISKGIYAFETFTQIALRLNRHTSTITREVWAQVKVKKWCYSAVKGEKLSKEKKNKSGRKKKLDLNMPLLHYVQGKLREDWSPEEIAKRIKIDYPKDNSMRISHETIYQYLYCLPKGELKKELMKSLRRERKRRLSRGSINSRRKRIEDIVSIEERPKEAEGRMIPGHWEGDLIVGKNHASAIGTLVERTTRLTIIVPLKEKTAFAVANAFTKAFKRIPKKLKKTLTYDRGSEMSLHRLFTDESNVKVFFADPYSPWQRGTNENTNGLIRQYFPKSTDFREVSIAELKEAEKRLNSRPRKVLNYYTPAEKFYELITKKKVAIDS